MNKIINSFNIKRVCVLFFFIAPFENYAQETTLNKYGLGVITSYLGYQACARKDSNKVMADLKKMIPGLVFDLRYAGKNNFMKTKLYPTLNTSFLRKPVAMALKKIQQELNSKGLGLKIFDAYRPYSVTERMWELVKDDRYAADPKKGSGHNRGISIDLTIIDMQTKRELLMGTGFDNFSDTAHHTFTDLPKATLHNRLLLRTIMEKHGFKALETEWWHYSFQNGQDFQLFNLSFEELRKSKF